jgi:hypothetical protein
MNAKALSFLLAPVAIAGGYALWPKPTVHTPINAAPAVAENSAAADAPAGAPLPPAEAVELMDAISSGAVKVEATSNGRERLRLQATNPGRTPIALRVPVGQVFESERNAVVAVRPASREIAPGATEEFTVPCAATRSLNRVADATYRPTYQGVPKIELFLTYLQDHVELSPGAVQTAILALTENLPLSAVSKFTSAGRALPSKFNTDAFRVETADLIQALAALRDVGVKDRDLALTVDPQLKIEAMIEPLCRAAAMRYYGIPEELEWEYWRAELLNGDPSTRHYALYGIARYYPEIALEMLPRWVRETKTNPVYRLSAIQALADTQRPEALPLLQTLSGELGAETDLGKAAVAATRYLDSHLAKVAALRTKVAFRSSGPGF